MPFKMDASHSYTKGSTLISLKDFSPGYRKGHFQNPLFINLNLSLHAGEMVCFMGSNGVGKSTLLRSLAGLQPSLSGEINFGSSDNAAKHFEQISIVLTDSINAANMTVYDLVAFGRYPYLGWNLKLLSEDKKIIEQSISSVNIAHLSDKRLDELSDGQRQMAMIARALAQDTPVILLDEPTSHLDLNNRVEIMRFLKKLARTTGKAILIATHELDLALQTADILWLADQNKSISAGVPEDLILNGALDNVFQFKGYDLKTGKINQDPHQGVSILLKGAGHEYQWTKNALERNGFSVSSEIGKEIIIQQQPKLSWLFEGGAYFSLGELLAQMD